MSGNAPQKETKIMKHLTNEQLIAAYLQTTHNAMGQAQQGYQVGTADSEPWTITAIVEELETRIGVEATRALLDPNGRNRPFVPQWPEVDNSEAIDRLCRS